MSKRMFFILFFLSIFSFTSFAVEFPTSKEAVILEASSSSELLLEAKGVYMSDKKSRRKRRKDIKKTGVRKAVWDAKKAAVYYLLFNGSDPLLKEADELQRFNKIADYVFSKDTINELITYSDNKPKYKVSLNRGEGVKVALNVKINYDYLRQLLEDNLVLFSKEELSYELGYPFVMVLPRSSTNKESLTQLGEDSLKQHTAGVIESFLTAKMFDVVIPEQADLQRSISNSFFALDNVESKPGHLALSIGADVYLDYSIGLSKGSYETDQVSVVIRAYESTTGRLLATETGYSKQRVGQEHLSIEEAAMTALRVVSERIMNYWEQDLNRGVQYKVLLSLDSETWSGDKKEQVIDDILESLDDVSLFVKENVTTQDFMDVSIWCSNEDYLSAREVFKDIREVFSEFQSSIDLHLVFQNRKILAVEVK